MLGDAEGKKVGSGVMGVVGAAVVGAFVGLWVGRAVGCSFRREFGKS